MSLRTIAPDELATILESHAKWLRDEGGGERADLRWADLRWADLRWADLRWANLRWADLRWANLSDTACCHARLGSYDVWTSPTHARIGCQFHANEDWLKVTPERAEQSSFGGAREWWRIYRDCVFSMIRCSQQQAIEIAAKREVAS